MPTAPADADAPSMPDEVAGLRILGACDNYTPSSSGGAERAAHEIYARIGAAGADIKVLSLPHGEPYDDPGVAVVVAKGIDLSRFIGGYFGVSPDVFRKAGHQRRQLAPQVLHANTIHYNACIALAHQARRHRLPLVITAQLGPMTEMPFMTRLAGNSYERTAGRYILKRATSVLAVSQTVRQHVIDLGADPSTVQVVENGVDHERFDAPDLQGSAAPTILAVGRLVDNKGPQLLTEAAIDLLDRGRTFVVRFLGDGPLRAELEAKVEAAGHSDRIRFEGQVSDVERWMADADVVVRPSFTEGLPLAVLEAMSAGRCCIVSDIAPNLELITDRATGFSFRAGSATDLARALDEALGDPVLRVQVAKAGRVASRTRSWDRMASETAGELLRVAKLGR